MRSVPYFYLKGSDYRVVVFAEIPVVQRLYCDIVRSHLSGAHRVKGVERMWSNQTSVGFPGTKRISSKDQLIINVGDLNC